MAVMQKFEGYMAEYKRRYDIELGMTDDDVELQLNCDAVRMECLCPAIDCAETLDDCERISIALISNGDPNRNLFLKDKLAKKRKELKSNKEG